MEISCLLIQAMSGLIAVENNLGLLLALAILKDSAPIGRINFTRWYIT